MIQAQLGSDDLANASLDIATEGVEPLLLRDPTSAVFLAAKADVMMTRCQLATARGEYSKALIQCESALASYRAMVKSAPDPSLSDSASIALAARSELELQAGNRGKALLTAKEALAANETVDNDADNALHDESRARSFLAFARAELASIGLAQSAAMDARKAAETFDALLRASPKNVLQATLAVTAHTVLADALYASHDLGGADTSYAAASATCDSIDPNRRVLDLRLACAETDAKRSSRASEPTQAAALRDHARALVATIPPARIRPIANARWLRDLAH